MPHGLGNAIRFDIAQMVGDKKWHLSAPAGGTVARRSQSFRRKRHLRHCLVQNDTLDRIEVPLPGRLLKSFHCCAIAGGSTRTDAGRTEIYVLGMIFVSDARSKKTHYVHLRHTSIAGEILHHCAVAKFTWHLANQLTYNVTQSMSLLLSRDMDCDAT
jgi:hypothetical protein